MKQEFLEKYYKQFNNIVGGYAYTKNYDYWVEIKHYLLSDNERKTCIYMYQYKKNTSNLQKKWTYLVTKENGQIKFKPDKEY